MTNKYATTLERVFEEFTKEEVSAVYLTGSNLNNLTVSDSDVDVYVVLEMSFVDFFRGERKTGEKVSEDLDFKFVDKYTFVKSLEKANPNNLEMLFKKPLYVSESFKKVSDFMYGNREQLFFMNERRMYSASYHLMENCVRDMKKLPLGEESNYRLGKLACQFLKNYFRLVGFGNTFLDALVFFEGEKRECLLDYKLNFGSKNLDEVLEDFKQKLEETEQLKVEKSDVLLNTELLEKLANKLK